MKMQSNYFYAKQLGTEAISLLQQNLFNSIIGDKTLFKTAALKKIVNSLLVCLPNGSQDNQLLN